MQDFMYASASKTEMKMQLPPHSDIHVVLLYNDILIELKANDTNSESCMDDNSDFFDTCFTPVMTKKWMTKKGHVDRC